MTKKNLRDDIKRSIRAEFALLKVLADNYTAALGRLSRYIADENVVHAQINQLEQTNHTIATAHTELGGHQATHEANVDSFVQSVNQKLPVDCSFTDWTAPITCTSANLVQGRKDSTTSWYCNDNTIPEGSYLQTRTVQSPSNGGKDCDAQEKTRLTRTGHCSLHCPTRGFGGCTENYADNSQAICAQQ